MKNATSILAVLVCLSVIGGSTAVAIKPVECLLIVEKIKRSYLDIRTAKYVNEIVRSKQGSKEATGK